MADLEKTSSTEIAVIYDEEDIGAGYEHQSKADTTIPFIVLLQGLSPQCVEQREGCKPGAWFNTATEDVYPKDEGFNFVPATTRHYFGEWTPRKLGGGFHGHYAPDEQIVLQAIKEAEQFGKYTLDNGNELVECFYVYGIVDFMDMLSMAVIGFKATMIRSYKSWQTRLQQLRIPTPDGRMIRPPLYAHLTNITSKMRQNEKGQFYVPSITAANGTLMESLIPANDERFQMAKALRKLVDSGDAIIDPDQDQPKQDDTPF